MATIGSQALLRIIPRTRYDFSQLRGGTVQIPIAQHVDVLGFERAAVQVRIYRGVVPPKSSLDIRIADDGFGGEGSSETFLQTQNSNGDDIGKLHIPDSAIFPFYQSIAIAIPGIIGRMMTVLVSFTGGPDGGPTVELSVDLVLTGGSVGGKVYQPSTYLGYAHETVETVEAFEPLTAPPIASGDLSESRLAQLLSDAIRKAIAGNRPVFDPPDGGTYARFGNVNVGVADPGRRPDVGEEKLAAVLSSAVQEALVRGALNLDTPDGGYARFGNVNVGVAGRPQLEDAEEKLRVILTGAIREALRRGDLDLETPDGGYARFGNVNVGRGTMGTESDT